jgi:predicted nuclease with TOPRIM domain
MNLLIKKEYRNYKEEIKNAMKEKIEEEIQGHREMETTLKDSYKQLQQQFMAQKEKLNSLKKENETIKDRKDRVMP